MARRASYMAFESAELCPRQGGNQQIAGNAQLVAKDSNLMNKMLRAKGRDGERECTNFKGKRSGAFLFQFF